MPWLILGLLLLIEIGKYGYRCQEAPKVNPFVFPNGLTIGSRAKVTCVAYLGDQPLTFRWLKDGQELSTGDVRRIDESTSALVLEPLSLKHIGNYTCVASNSVGYDRVTAKLFVKAPPKWVIEPSDASVKAGEKVMVDCQADGSPEVQITWKKSENLGGLVPVPASRNVEVLLNNSLVISNIQKSEGGVYVCEVNNGVGDGLSKVVKLTVYELPVVQKVIDHLTVERGQTAFLSCVATGDEPLDFRWMKNKIALDEQPGLSKRVSFSKDDSSGNVHFTVAISHTVIEDEGLYTCVAENEFGSDEKDIRLFLVERPKAPDYVEIVDIWSRSARIRWGTPSNGNSPILSYTVEYWAQSGDRMNETVSSASTTHILRNLNPFTLYVFHVWASNAIGASEASNQEQFTTSKEEPSSPPMNIHLEETGSNFVRLSWRPPPRENWNGGLSGYYIGYKQDSSSQPFTFNTVECEDDTVYYVLRGLKKNTRYLAVVKAYNEIGSGPPSEEISFRTHNQEPPPQPTLMVSNIGSTFLQVQWYVPSDRKFQVTGFTLYYRKGSGKWLEIAMPDPQMSFTLTNLDVAETYQIFVISHSSYGISEPSEIATVRTSLENIVHAAPTPQEQPEKVDEVTQALYIVVPVAVATVIIVIVVVVACTYVHLSRPLPKHNLYGDLPADKSFSYMATAPRRRDPPIPMCIDTGAKQQSPYSAVPLTRPEPEEEEPIYESVVEEIRCKIKQRQFEDEKHIGSGTIV